MLRDGGKSMVNISNQKVKQDQIHVKHSENDQSSYQRMIPSYHRKSDDKNVNVLTDDDMKIREILGKAAMIL